MHVYTTGINNLFLEADHLAIIWGEEWFAVLSEIVDSLIK